MPTETADDYHDRLIRAVTKTLFTESLIDLDGRQTAYVRTAEASEALISVLGMLMEGAPNCQTPQGMRKMSEAVGRNTLAAMKAARKVREERGHGILGPDSILIN